jgi:uncharacterized membrane protein YraQ (UPF0718 family)
MRPVKQQNKRKITMTLMTMVIFAAVLTFIAYQKSPATALEGLKSGGKLFWDILPAMIFAFIAAGMMLHVLPRDLLTRWLGEDSGFTGLIIAGIAGSITPGGPFIQFPLVAALYKSGAGIAPLMTYISAWSLIAIQRFFVYEVPMLGLKLSVVRILVSAIFPILIGIVTKFIYSRI